MSGFFKLFKFFVWCFILLITTFILPFQLFQFFIFYILYFVIFIFKYFFLRFGLTEINNISYKKINLNNSFFVFVKFFLIDLPKKKAFFVFYQSLYYYNNTNNKKEVLKFFKEYKLILSLLKKYILIIIFKMITTFPLICVKNTNFVFHRFFQIWDLNWHSIRVFYSNFIINLLIDYNEIQNEINNYKIKFENNNIIFNPKDLKLYDVLLKNLKSITEYNIASTNVKYSSVVNITSYNSSVNMISCSKKLDEETTYNTVFIPKKDVSKVIINKKEVDEYLIKSKPHLEKTNKDFIHTISGYNESEDFHRYVDKPLLKANELELNELLSTASEDFYRIPGHLVSSKYQNLENGRNFAVDFEKFSGLKENLGKDLVLNWKKPILEYKLTNNNNLVFNDKEYTLEQFFNMNWHKYDFELKSTIDTVNDYYRDNQEVLKNLNPEAFENYIKNSNLNLNWGSKFIYKKTDSFEKRGQNYKDAYDKWDGKDILNNLVQKAKDLIENNQIL